MFVSEFANVSNVERYANLNNQNKPEKHQALPFPSRPKKKEFVHFINGHMFMFCFLHILRLRT
ncbi:hypothetical protein DERF_011831 [Dermatophagoides farinae]|uniref:Uncharacterized protein n=1 Tax=Dermatophagoides farinae TaxID=6954 RepID=A0A922HVN1_DERFA|nr:hypothetical protein DERF_011831 [Dermatophagoides farinae]